MEDVKTVCAEKLEVLSKNITSAEKIESLDIVGISRPTLDKYLNGDIVKIETATKLIQFFTGKVKDRLNELRETNVA